MFRKAVILSFLFSCTVASIAYWDHMHLRPQDRDTYSQFIHGYKGQKTLSALESHPITQARWHIQKDLWIPENNLHLRIQADHSNIRLSEEHRKIEAVETLHGLVCRSDDRHLTAKEGRYVYPSLEMDCKEFCYRDEQIRLNADHAHLVYPEVLHCEGAIELVLSNNYALADQLDYAISTQMLILSATPRVLFCNDSMRLSAPEVRMRCNAHSTCDEIQGIGDVHCMFNLQEESLIETLFSKYL